MAGFIPCGIAFKAAEAPSLSHLFWLDPPHPHRSRLPLVMRPDPEDGSGAARQDPESRNGVHHTPPLGAPAAALHFSSFSVTMVSSIAKRNTEGG